ncbi:HdeD family acid-resistance protein [Convivina praedatoris]|uniref:Acid-resistance membrane protein n=1 Tax=Convivina praedatoris TaxID=2880963 RepID=A0ABN8HAL7_9LACO|nr:DUF308 domain-containing protein [Convivina sp. LMG 32447]CAH1855791.1 hypothetical protein R077815_01278 [Convivina sp. LMG 32447]CAH1856706.1 hypothetical protein LMG032447_01352 [Convivina sp. LMG 32447]CAH1856796.1 hypothetical protein R078138_01431 [Convivina sp. LMG 32447]
MEHRHINWFGILSGVVFIIFAFMIFSQPLETIISLSYIFGILAWIQAITSTVSAVRANQAGIPISGWRMFSIAFDILVGFVFIFHLGLGIGTIGFLFAIWFILDSVSGLYFARILNPVSRGAYWVTMVFGLISLVLGIILLFSPLMAATVLVYMIAFYLIVFGVSLIAASL